VFAPNLLRNKEDPTSLQRDSEKLISVVKSLLDQLDYFLSDKREIELSQVKGQLLQQMAENKTLRTQSGNLDTLSKENTDLKNSLDLLTKKQKKLKVTFFSMSPKHMHRIKVRRERRKLHC
jgi:hypothetical protein